MNHSLKELAVLFPTLIEAEITQAFANAEEKINVSKSEAAWQTHFETLREWSSVSDLGLRSDQQKCENNGEQRQV